MIGYVVPVIFQILDRELFVLNVRSLNHTKRWLPSLKFSSNNINNHQVIIRKNGIVNFVSTLISQTEEAAINVRCPEVEILMLNLNRDNTRINNKVVTSNSNNKHHNNNQMTLLEVQKKMPFLPVSVKMIGNVLNVKI